jgi:osmotically-inducible protein OsmY
MQNRRQRLVPKLVLLGMLSVITFAFQSPSWSQTESADSDLIAAIWSKLKEEKLDEEVVDVSIQDGAVVLTGRPKNAWLKMKIIEAVLEVEGVEAVESELEVAEAESDEALAEALVSEVLGYPHYGVFDDITFTLAEGGVVTLGGAVTMPFKKDEIEERIGKVMGVRELKSEIRVLPVSQTDDRLREQLFRNIYGNALFTGLANRRNPPIHIIVEGSRVILTGAVSSNVAKRTAESIARSTFGVVQLESRLVINP